MDCKDGRNSNMLMGYIHEIQQKHLLDRVSTTVHVQMVN